MEKTSEEIGRGVVASLRLLGALLEQLQDLQRRIHVDVWLVKSLTQEEEESAVEEVLGVSRLAEEPKEPVEMGLFLR